MIEVIKCVENFADDIGSTKTSLNNLKYDESKINKKYSNLAKKILHYIHRESGRVLII